MIFISKVKPDFDFILFFMLINFIYNETQAGMPVLLIRFQVFKYSHFLKVTM